MLTITLIGAAFVAGVLLSDKIKNALVAAYKKIFT